MSTLSDTEDTKPGEPPGPSDIRPVSILDEMKRSYLDYAMSVIVARALPDARDGLKPVHRRILYAMYENGFEWNKPYRKSARTVGDVIGKYHPHGDQSVYDAIVRMAQEFSMRVPSIDDLINIIPGPDFPTGGIILGRQGIRSAYHLGRGSIVMRGKVKMEAFGKDREAIIISEIPYQVNKATMVARIGELHREKKIDGIADLRDESDRDGYRVVVELKRDAMADVVLDQLYRFTPLQTNFCANMAALDGGRPQVMNLKDLLTLFIAFPEQWAPRPPKFLLTRARDRAHVLVGLAISVANHDEMIRVIRTSHDPNTAR